MTSKVISLAERLAAREAATAESENLDGELFLLDEGMDLLASYRSISDKAIRLRLKEAIDSAARGEVVPPPLIAAPPEPYRATAKTRFQRYRSAAVFVALLIGASAFLEIADPATTDVVAAAFKCHPAASSNP